MQFTWNLASECFEYIEAFNILEHLPETVRTMKELWRIRFNLFDPSSRQNKERRNYSTARFRITEIVCWLPLAPAREKSWVRVSNTFSKRLIGFFTRYFVM
jgi:hypothetical protein